MTFGQDAMRHRFTAVSVLGQPMLFTTAHLEHSTVPKGMFLYCVRHHSDDQEKPVQICQWALVNRYGSLLSPIQLEMKQHPHYDNLYLDIDPDKDWFTDGHRMSLATYLEEYPLP